jgi:hypothetical protein
LCFFCLDPSNSFSKFDINKLARLAEIYDADFSDHDRGIISEQLETYALQVRRHAAFANCTDIECLATKMVATKKTFGVSIGVQALALLVPVSGKIVLSNENY